MVYTSTSPFWPASHDSVLRSRSALLMGTKESSEFIGRMWPKPVTDRLGKRKAKGDCGVGFGCCVEVGHCYRPYNELSRQARDAEKRLLVP